MVFHRFIEGQVATERLTITVNGEKVPAWNPFAPREEHTAALPPKKFELSVGGVHGIVTLRPFVLPPRNRFSSLSEFERYSGPLKWNRQQGFYIYRADRMIQSGGWSGIRAADEHTKFARAALDFGTELDTLFHINVAKMRVAIPSELRTLLESAVHEVCRRADVVYRRDDAARSTTGRAVEQTARRTTSDSKMLGAALIAAAIDCGEHCALERIINRLRRQNRRVARELGW
jgi:hypothetical protein